MLITASTRICSRNEQHKIVELEDGSQRGEPKLSIFKFIDENRQAAIEMKVSTTGSAACYK